MIIHPEGMPAIAPQSSSEGRWPRICEIRPLPRPVAMVSMHTSPLALPGGSRDAGGMNIYVRELARHLGCSGTPVDVFTRRTDPTLPDIVPLGPHARLVHITAGSPGLLSKEALFALTPTFAAGIQRFAAQAQRVYSVVHSHYWLSGVAGLTLARAWDAPHVAMFHTLARLKQFAQPGSYEPPQRAEAERRIICESDAVVVATADERRQIARLYGASGAHLHIIPCGVDLARFTPGDRDTARAQLAQQLHLGADPLLLAVGRLDPLKGADLLVHMLLSVEANATLALVGGDEADPERARLRDLATELGVADRIRFIDAAPQEQLPAYYRAADLLLVASHYESFGMVAVEALACGTPVVAAKVGGLPYIVRDGENGVLVAPRTPDQFAKQVNRLLAAPQSLAALARRARASVTRFGWSAIAAQVSTLYSELSQAAFPEAALAE